MVDRERIEFERKIAYFQQITGIEDSELCTEILNAHGGDLELAVSLFSITDDCSIPSRSPSPSIVNHGTVYAPTPVHENPSLAWNIITLPFYVVAGVVGISTSFLEGVVCQSLGLLGRRGTYPSSSTSSSYSGISTATETLDFVQALEFQYGAKRPDFVEERFVDALHRAHRESRLLFVYLHSPDHPDTSGFCTDCLCTDVVAGFINANFVPWGGDIRRSEGFSMCNALSAATFPFCAVILPSISHNVILLKQIEGTKSPEELILMLQLVIEVGGPLIAAGEIEAEERIKGIQLREEQDTAYQAALEADRAKECQRKEEQHRLERTAAEADRKCKEEDAREQIAREAMETEAARAKKRQEIAESFGEEPEKGSDITEVLLRFPTGERKQRRFKNSAIIKTIYNYVDSLNCLNGQEYTLVSNFPRILYGPEKHSFTLKEAGIHPQASLFIHL